MNRDKLKVNESIHEEERSLMLFRSRFYGCDEKSVKGNLPESTKTGFGFGQRWRMDGAGLRHSFLGRFLHVLESFFVFGALGLVSFGLFLDWELERSAGSWAWLWFFGALFVYNLDRLHPDPADAINAPHREALPLARRIVIGIAVLALLVIPLAQQEWLIFAVTLAAAAVASRYTLPVPLLKRRVKDLAILKNGFPAIIITAALFFPCAHSAGWRVPPNAFALAAYAFLGVLLNLLVCDLRDVDGDLHSKVSTPANVLSRKAFRCLLWILFGMQTSAIFFTPHPSHLAGLSVYLAGLIWQSQKAQPAWFYTWGVDGMLFVPALQQLLSRG